MYHGVRVTSDGPIYRVGLALLDLEDPGKLLHRTDTWVFGPEAPYEITGDVGRVVFPCGWVHDVEGRPTPPLLRRRGQVIGACDGHVQRGHGPGLCRAAHCASKGTRPTELAARDTASPTNHVLRVGLQAEMQP